MSTKATASSKSKPATTRKTPSATSTTESKVVASESAAKPAVAAEPEVVTETTAMVAEMELKKRELIDKVVERSGTKKKHAKPAVEAMIDILAEALADGREINLQPLGRIMTQRSKDTTNARVIIAKIRQSKSAQPALDPQDRADADNSNEVVAEPAE